MVTSVRGIALDPITAASVLLGVIGFMKAAFGLRFLPLFFAFFFAISISPLNYSRCDRVRCCRYGLAVTRRWMKWQSDANDFQRENELRSLCCANPATRRAEFWIDSFPWNVAASALA